MNKNYKKVIICFILLLLLNIAYFPNHNTFNELITIESDLPEKD